MILPGHPHGLRGAAAAFGALHYQIDTFTDSGTWTAPAGVETVDYAEAWGAGGGSRYDSGTTTRNSGGGAAYARKENISVTPGNGYSVTVGAGAGDTDGEPSSFIDSSTLLAVGGKSATNGRAGGLASECVGDVKYDGGDGTTSSASNQGGGGAAADQGAASGLIPGQRQAGRVVSAGVSRSVPGSGGSSTSTGNAPGARGEIRIHYKRPALAGFPRVVSRNWNRVAPLDTLPTAHSILMPPDIVAGNLLLVWFGIRNAPDLTIPEDWTVLADVANSTNNKAALLYKFAEGSDSLTITTSLARFSSHLTWQIDTAGVPTASTATGSSSSIAPPNHEPAAGSDKYLWLALEADHGNGRRSTAEPPANYESFNYMNDANNLNGVVVAAAERFLEASSETPSAFLGSQNNAYIAATVSIPYVAV